MTKTIESMLFIRPAELEVTTSCYLKQIVFLKFLHIDKGAGPVNLLLYSHGMKKEKNTKNTVHSEYFISHILPLIIIIIITKYTLI